MSKSTRCGDCVHRGVCRHKESFIEQLAKLESLGKHDTFVWSVRCKEFMEDTRTRDFELYKKEQTQEYNGYVTKDTGTAVEEWGKEWGKTI